MFHRGGIVPRGSQIPPAELVVGPSRNRDGVPIVELTPNVELLLYWGAAAGSSV